ncbi:mitochondrial carrier [Basidiobolus meristosporus CBS 931.73]|uniref:Mitochondrial carrier n=1 Tax=Basidiobolus meristosporus CBS 931.73 TaxID=1314790 RepID=A0A1Y1Y0J8_9FUNG|nr:mitochondrial carrier [Basidiobolus meristosporus CBS 931.73]|eukprot:ORX91498.1 mitochondrial carrier [Basidiobolus meristosporus CBS 931.73]
MPDAKTYPFWFGGVATCFATLCTHPFDVVKVQLQTNEAKLRRSDPGAFKTMSNLVKRNGWLCLYDGLSGSVFRQATYSTTRFALYDIIKGQLADKDGRLSILNASLASIVSGVVGGIVGNPADVVMIRMANDRKLPLAEQRQYRHVFDGFTRIIKDEGVRCLFRGINPNMVRAIAVTSSQLASYDQIKEILIFHVGWSDDFRTHLTCSLLAGLVATTVCSPVDVIKTRVMNSSRRMGAIGTLTSMLKNEGIRGFFKGWLPSYMRLGPHTLVTFLTLERLRQWYDGHRRVGTPGTA